VSELKLTKGKNGTALFKVYYTQDHYDLIHRINLGGWKWWI